MKICEDSEIIYDIFNENEIIKIDDLLKEIEFNQIKSQGSLVPRLIAIQGEIIDGNVPLYRHPADEQPLLKPFTKTTNLILNKLNKLFNQNMNHVLIQFYRNGKDNIGEHSDKTLDILHNTLIINFSVGETRTLRLRNKLTKNKEYIELKNNSIFILGSETNRKWMHEIKSNSQIKGSRISFTFRTIATFIDKYGKIIGQGSSKNLDKKNLDEKNLDKKNLDENNLDEKNLDENNLDEKNLDENNLDKNNLDEKNLDDSLNMLKAFSKENHEYNFNWNENYGKGFTALNFKFKYSDLL